MLKWALRIVLIVVLLAVIAAGVLMVYLDRLAATVLTEGIEAVGEAPCQVERVHVSLWEGLAVIDGLSILNPGGYPDGKMLDASRVNVRMRVGSLWDQPLDIHQLELVEPMIRVEPGEGGSNIGVFVANVQHNLGLEDQIRMRVDKLLVRDATICFGGGIGNGDLMRIPLAGLELSNIHGPEGKGLTAGELSAAILMELVRNAVQAGDIELESIIPPEVLKGLDTIMIVPSTILKSAVNMFKGPLEVLLGSRPSLPTTAGSDE